MTTQLPLQNLNNEINNNNTKNRYKQFQQCENKFGQSKHKFKLK